MPKKNKTKKFFRIFLYLGFSIIILWIIVGFFFFFYKTPDSIYVFPENPKQGDTVFIRVKSEAGEITGNFNSQKIYFYKKGGSSWVSFLGIDADQEPGDYKIFVDVSASKKLTKEIKISLADFSISPPALAPSQKQTGYTTERAISNITKTDNPAIKKFISNLTEKPYFNGPFSFPLIAMQKSGFSFGKFINFAQYKLQHFGVDLRAPKKTEIYAVNDGKVLATLNLSNYGKTVIIDHGLDIFSLYLHLDQFEVAEGQMVKRDQIIGLSGDTGYVTAPHLHFSMRAGGARVDPIAFIEITKKVDYDFVLADISNAFLNIINQK